ncbi:hypothetical protein OG943_42150 [Amycolatopsis sp. NBC_00345]|uniref:hypothetical protein n=1 Tax=Amycolatopsis sp. NBC_00345 TaxID=2975955 RepID=UPI002E271B43
MAAGKTPKRQGSRPGKPVEPLLDALTRSGIGGFPIEIWLAMANAMAPAGVRYQDADAKALCRARPDQVSAHQTADGMRYQLAVGADGAVGRLLMSDPSIAAAMEDTFGPFTVEDKIAAALIELLDTPASDPGVRRYLERHLPAQCADGTGSGIGALRARAGERGIDLLLAKALDRRASRVSSAEKVAMRREAVTLFAAAGAVAESAELRGVLSADLAAAGDLAAAIEELELAAADYRQEAARNSFQLKFVALTELNLGRLYSRAGRRGDARTATKTAVALFASIAAEDHRFADEVQVARRQLKQLRWRGTVR